MNELCVLISTLVWATAARPAPQERQVTADRLQALWSKLDALQKEKEDLAWKRWQALSDLEKARIIVKHRRQGGPTEEELAALTEEEAPEVLA